ncbi:PREDICTED: uncharacterized protein LOC105562049 [Vollenhovia emeryi]|uniref:uncharacterized protein LOC105562049 n=1 Tax=Vollenhovia emeryi TaxID=411798 RepID=UPI0005F3EEC7|nr:PREDICTED: uncharacterized protein LOC105562049 [Vollenhovia emeryi]
MPRRAAWKLSGIAEGRVEDASVFIVLPPRRGQPCHLARAEGATASCWTTRVSSPNAHPSECTDDERPSMIGECVTFVKPDSTEHSRVPRSHSCFYTRVLDLLTGGGS